MPLPMYCGWKHYVCCLLVHLSVCAYCMYIVYVRNTVNMYLEKYQTHFLPSYGTDAFWDRDEHIRFWGQNVNFGHFGYSGIKYAENSTLKVDAYSMHGVIQCDTVLPFITAHVCCVLANDCFELGRLAYLEKDYYHTLLWMHEALNRVDDDDQFYAAVLDYLAYATYMVSVTQQSVITSYLERFHSVAVTTEIVTLVIVAF